MADYGRRSPLLSQIWYVYILECNDGNIYTGCTNNLEDRIKRHALGQVRSTESRRPIKLITYIGFTEKNKAYAFEKHLKSGSGRAFSKRHF